MAEIAIRLHIHGTVQGVGYRDWAVRVAQPLALHGWVRNRLDGSVEALVLGEEDAVRQFVTQCHRGPAAAAVTEVTEEAALGIVPRYGFLRKPTV